MRTFKKQATISGWLYAAVAVTAPLGQFHVQGKLIHGDDGTAAALALTESSDLLGAVIASELFHQAVAVWLVLALFRLFCPIDRYLARSLAFFGLVSIPITSVNILNQLGVLTLQSGLNDLAALGTVQIDALTSLFMRLHSLGSLIAVMFWGLSLFPFGRLVTRCGFIPPILGYLLWVAGIGYALKSIVALAMPQFLNQVDQLANVMTACEAPIILWLLFVGARGDRAKEFVDG